jgi:hypothetical protein
MCTKVAIKHQSSSSYLVHNNGRLQEHNTDASKWYCEVNIYVYEDILSSEIILFSYTLVDIA